MTGARSGTQQPGPTVARRFETFDESVVEALKRRVGTPLGERSPTPFVTEVNGDAIRHWAYGIGDYNPLWVDPDYAAAHGGLTAPPSMQYAFDKRVTGGAMGLPGIHGMFAGVRWEWFRPIREGDRISVVEANVKEVKERQGRFAGRQLQVTAEIVLADEHGEVVAVSNPYGFRMERDRARERAKYQAGERPVYSEEELARIWGVERAERPRGAEPRVVTGVVAGDELTPIVRGPLTVSDNIVFLMGWGGQYVRAHGDWIRWLDRHPAGGIPNEFGVPETSEAVHWDHNVAQAVGVPAPYDYGPQRVAWAVTFLTNWMGDAGVLRTLSVELRRHVMVGDTVWFGGQVSAVDVSSGAVAVTLRGTNQDGDAVIQGEAELRLPRPTDGPPTGAGPSAQGAVAGS